MSFAEIVVILLVGLVVFGPKELPKIAKSTAQVLRRVVRWAYDLRAQSGIDDVLRAEGLEDVKKDLADIRRVARGELDGLVEATRPRFDDVPLSPYSNLAESPRALELSHEHPDEGPDNYGAMRETAGDYAEALPASKWCEDPLYVRGELGDPPQARTLDDHPSKGAP